MLSEQQKKEIVSLRDQVRALAKDSQVEKIKTEMQEVQKLSDEMFSLSWPIREMAGVGNILEDVKNRLAEAKGMAEAAEELKSMK
jgi:hypothetical protein